jgi:lysyl-tRNA synthetase class 2
MFHVSKNNWQPSGSVENLKKRADIIDKIRSFFKSRQVLEVETPLLSHATITDAHVESIPVSNFSAQTQKNKPFLYLQTSPEFAMKRLLAAGYPSIFQMGKVFRLEECSERHNPEFTMLEWYRLGFNHHDLMNEIDELLQYTLGTSKAERISYHELFQRHLQMNPHTASIEALKKCAIDNNIQLVGLFAPENLDRDDWLNLLLTHLLEPTLQKPTFLYGYPTSQAALAKIENGVAARFELYINGLELANGFYELSDVQEQRKRIANDLAVRRANGLHEPQVDENFLSALEAGLPECAGVALGVDRLIMIALGETDIKKVLSFGFGVA